MQNVFLTAQWRKLAMINYVVDPAILERFVPARTELDSWNGSCYVSLVGFVFLRTKVKGFYIPFHVNFEEVNLRFYVKHKDGNNEWKRGVVFIKEIVPRPALTWVANKIYNEHYVTMPMKHFFEVTEDSIGVEYGWKAERWNKVSIRAGLPAKKILEGSEEEFITEHYWGYTKINESKTSEYAVEHPRWEVYPMLNYDVDVDFGQLYGKEFDFLSKAVPRSVFLAEGSEILVRGGEYIK